jgi:hypothetical protein
VTGIAIDRRRPIGARRNGGNFRDGGRSMVASLQTNSI